MDKLIKRVFWAAVVTAAAMLWLSFAGLFEPVVGQIGFAVTLIGTLLLAIKDLRYPFLIVIVELVIGSQGYAFSLGGQEQGLSVRIGIWVIIMGVWAATRIVALLRRKTTLKEALAIPYGRQFLFMAGALALSAIIASVAGNDPTFIFLEAKRWAYALILIPFLQTFTNKDDFKFALASAAGAASVLAIFTLKLAYLFSHDFGPLILDTYTWLRQTLLGEITPGPSGFSRIFTQSQIFLIPAFCASFALAARQLVTRCYQSAAWLSLASAVFFAALLASLSRSFWIGIAAATVMGAVVIIWQSRPRWRSAVETAGLMLVVLIGGAALLFAVVRFPVPQPLGQAGLSILSDRANSSEAAAASRWSLLPVMGKEIMTSPLWGHGLGKTLTYVTSDPRITRSTVGGEYTTYAFEWGWLDIALKTGLMGLAAYLYLLWSIGRDAFQTTHQAKLVGVILSASLIAIVVVHFFTPYLNHPLGFMYLGLIIAGIHSFGEGGFWTRLFKR